MYCILRLRNHGEVSYFLTDDKKYAHICYYTALLFDVLEDSFIALFEREIMLKNNQTEKSLPTNRYTKSKKFTVQQVTRKEIEMQDTRIMAFRKRLKKRGYDDIKIKRVYPETKVNGDYLYEVSAIDPLTRKYVKADYTATRMNYSFRHDNLGGAPYIEESK